MSVDAPLSDDAPVVETRRYGAALTWSHGQPVLHTDPAGYPALMADLYADGYRMCSDLCGVDRLLAPAGDLPEGVAAGRFEVVVNLRCLDDRRSIRVRVQLEGNDPTLASVYPLYPGVEAMEREVYDFFGVIFVGHPDLSRILMPDDWEGHPLRKDYATGRIPVQFKAAPGPR
ncbi:MAG: NADH-quinone oxidoreductase subunit C [Acidimicrobiales bacterium]